MTPPALPRRTIRACVVGSVNVDLFLVVDELPGPGETVLGRGTRRAVGGKGANQAVALSRLGAAVTLVGAVGEDDDGRTATATIAADGVEHGGLRRIPDQPTGLAAITVDARGENTIVVTAGANESCTPVVVRDEGWRIQAAEVVVAQLEIPIDSVLAAFGIAGSSRTLRVLNGAPARPVPDGLFRLTDVLIVNELEAATLSEVRHDPEEAAFGLVERGPNVVVVTLGAQGSLAVENTGVVHRAPPHPILPVDTTGAGDAFVACFALLHASGADVAESLRAANVAAALSTTAPGAQAGLPTWDELVAALG
ncbi:MAG TPA: ribokinase [Candidatus Limnocylindrales bacterium]|nr:ribokinase [Candidatus Limnocylindrales bacterium]